MAPADPQSGLGSAASNDHPASGAAIHGRS